MDTRAPKKGQGVPRQTQDRNSIDALAAAVDVVGDGARIAPWLASHGFFDATMTAQVRLMAQAALEAAPEPRALIDALCASDDDRVVGVAAAVPRLAMSDVGAQLAALRRVAAEPSTWARELAQSELHVMCIELGVQPVLARVSRWIRDDDDAVRRVLVEALRPRGVMLPHIEELKRDPSPLWPLVAQVLDDPSDYVRKAAANLLNDVSRDHPELLLDRVAEWTSEPPGAERAFIIERGLRTLIKQRHAGALAALGYAPASRLDARLTEAPPPELALNALMPFAVEVTNPTNKDARVVARIDVTEPGAGERTRSSSYLLAKSLVPPGERVELRRRVHFVDRNRQPKLDGTYVFSVTVNGDPIGEASASFRRR